MLITNEGKNPDIEVDGKTYRRFAIKTRVLGEGDDLPMEAKHYTEDVIEPGDILVMSEKMTAATQGRAIPIDTIHPSGLAKFLVKFVYKNPGGIGISMPESMEMALKECGRARILFAAFVSAIGKLFGRRGWFYKVAGSRASTIDGPADYVVPPLNKCVVLGPLNPDETAKKVADAVGATVLIIDINDLGGVVLGSSDPTIDRDLIVRIMKDNPLGQTKQQTPLGIIRLSI
jgi:hypothetical protein